jgi:hypothetical protein
VIEYAMLCCLVSFLVFAALVAVGPNVESPIASTGAKVGALPPESSSASTTTSTSTTTTTTTTLVAP